MRTSYEYLIIVEGHIPPQWADRFDGMNLISGPDKTRLLGPLADNSALLGLLDHLSALNLNLISVQRLPCSGNPNGLEQR